MFVPPGRYDFGVGNGTNHGLEVDTEFVDLVGMGAAPRDVVLTSQINTASRGTLEQTGDDVDLRNFALELSNTTYTLNEDATDIASYFPSTNLTETTLTDIVIIIPIASLANVGEAA